ncbi:MAG: DUF2207 domain-containing protein, partial [Bacilli bacterium]|nr:DUF2207 domain-containing protein [Bacilli bacterium]
MKKFYLFLFLIASLFMMDKVSANTIYGIETTVDIDENGNGYVTEVWDMQANEGTESYHSFGNLEDRKITDFKVSMDDRQYTYVDSWNINASKSEKSYKNGINYTNGGLELCHGIEYGRHIYVINYIVENLVWQYNDTQIMYFSFLPQNMNPAPKVYNLTVFNKGNNEGIKYSSYGFKSKNSISNEGISFKSDGVLKSSDYVVALIGFPNGTFNSLKIVKNSGYDDVVSEALEGAKLNKSQTIWDLIGILIWPLIVLVMVVVAIVATIFEAKSKMRIDKTNYNIPKKVNNFRDIPFNKDFLLAYYIAREEGIFDKKNLIGAYLLKWIKEKKIEMVPTEGGFLDFNKNDNYYIDITNLDGFTEGVENSLCSFLRLASKDGKVTPKSFKKYCSKHYTEIENWLDRADGVSENRLVSEGYFT